MEKFRKNVERDRQNEQLLLSLGWRVATIWECETKTPAVMEVRLDDILRKDGAIDA